MPIGRFSWAAGSIRKENTYIFELRRLTSTISRAAREASHHAVAHWIRFEWPRLHNSLFRNRDWKQISKILHYAWNRLQHCNCMRTCQCKMMESRNIPNAETVMQPLSDKMYLEGAVIVEAEVLERWSYHIALLMTLCIGWPNVDAVDGWRQVRYGSL